MKLPLPLPEPLDDIDPDTHVGPLPSPCVNICQMDADSGLCRGCLRTMAEITHWVNADEAFKREVWLRIRRHLQAP